MISNTGGQTRAMGYSLTEDVLSAVSHGIGAMLAVFGLIALLARGMHHQDGWQVVAGGVFGASLVIAYLASTLYHSIRLDGLRLLLRKLDHSAIYLLIAGTYTGLMLGVIRGGWGWSFFAIAWAIAVAGILLKVFRMGKHPRLSLATYLGMGWLCIIGIYPLWVHLPRMSFYLLLLGGVIYSLGAILYAMKRIPYTHAIWHLFVLGGSVSHYFCIFTAFRP